MTRAKRGYNLCRDEGRAHQKFVAFACTKNIKSNGQRLYHLVDASQRYEKTADCMNLPEARKLFGREEIFVSSKACNFQGQCQMTCIKTTEA